MRYAYPCQITRHEEDDFVVTFPDVTGAITGGASRAEALELAGDALAAALGMYVELRDPIPVPSQVAADTSRSACWRRGTKRSR